MTLPTVFRSINGSLNLSSFGSINKVADVKLMWYYLFIMKEILAGKTIRVIKKAFSQRKDVLLAYIFGSRVAGFEAKNSDLDLAVFVRDKKKLSERDILYLLENLPIASSLHVSCVNLDSPPLFLYQIIKNGDCIYAKDKGERVKLEARILDLYYDNQHIRNIYRHYLQKSLREGTYGH